MIPGDVLEELWRRCPPGIKSQVEETARMRYSGCGRGDGAGDIDMGDLDATDKASGASNAPLTPPRIPQGRLSMSQLLLANNSAQQMSSGSKDESDMMEPKDPDPFLSVDMENFRNRRRQSLAPPTPPSSQSEPMTPSRSNGRARSPLTDVKATPTRPDLAAQPPPDTSPVVRAKRAKTILSRRSSASFVAVKPSPAANSDDILVRIFRHLNVGDLVRMRIVCRRWREMLTSSPDLCHEVDLSRYIRTVNDEVIAHVLAPFIGARAVTVDISNCFHVTDEGFSALWRSCGKNVKRWRMRSVWDVSANQILEMSDNAKNLEEIDWSNCRKVGDNLLGRVVGWVVPGASPPGTTAMTKRNNGMMMASLNPSGQPRDKKRTRKTTRARHAQHANGADHDDDEASKTSQHGATAALGPGAVVGCPKLSRLNLSYCKHVTDRSMAHLAAHASSRLESLSLTRCTSITDAGFQAWTGYRFDRLTRLCLADCTYLTDHAIVALACSAKNLTHLDLSFCCALSDTSTEVVALSLPKLRELRLAFCGSAVSDGSLESIALHLDELEGLSMRGCVRVTGRGLESVLEGCERLDWVDVSQCRNLEPWLSAGSLTAWGYDDRGPRQPPGMIPAPAPHVTDDATGSPPPPPPPSVVEMLATPGLLSRARFGGFTGRRTRRPVRFIVAKGGQGLR